MSSSRQPEVLAFGEPLIGMYPVEGGSGNPEYALTWGGDASNVALALCRLGHPGAMLARVGRDEFGESFLRLWKQRGVETSLVQRDAEHRTGLYFAFFCAGRHTLSYYRENSAACHIDLREFDRRPLEGMRVLHLSSISQAISHKALEASFELMHSARRDGITVSYDVNYRPALWAKDTAAAIILHTISRYVDILEITEEEMRLLGLGEKPEDLPRALPHAPRLCAIKAGPEGCLLLQGDQSVRAEPPEVRVKDTVGAGDAFDAGLLAGFLEARDIRQMAAMANAAGALTCRGVGSTECQPTREELDRAMG